jgi:hypothetical protein
MATATERVLAAIAELGDEDLELVARFSETLARKRTPRPARARVHHHRPQVTGGTSDAT